MTHRLPHSAGFGGKFLRAAFGIAAITGPVVFGLVRSPETHAQSSPPIGAPLPTFEVASIKPVRPRARPFFIWFNPGRFTTTSTIKRLIAFAYKTNDFQVSGGPGWINSEMYDVDAKVADSLVEELQELPFDLRRERIDLMIQSLLADRFKLKVSHYTKELPIYALLVAKNGAKLQEAKAGERYPTGGHPGFGTINAGQIIGEGIPVSAPRGMSLVWLLSNPLARPVLDQTGLRGKYDVTLKWTPDQSPAGMVPRPGGGKPNDDNAPPETSGPSLFQAIQEQLGLKLESTKGPVEILVIEQIARPSEN